MIAGYGEWAYCLAQKEKGEEVDIGVANYHNWIVEKRANLRPMRTVRIGSCGMRVHL